MNRLPSAPLSHASYVALDSLPSDYPQEPHPLENDQMPRDLKAQIV